MVKIIMPASRWQKIADSETCSILPGKRRRSKSLIWVTCHCFIILQSWRTILRRIIQVFLGPIFVILNSFFFGWAALNLEHFRLEACLEEARLKWGTESRDQNVFDRKWPGVVCQAISRNPNPPKLGNWGGGVWEPPPPNGATPNSTYCQPLLNQTATEPEPLCIEENFELKEALSYYMKNWFLFLWRNITQDCIFWHIRFGTLVGGAFGFVLKTRFWPAIPD